MRKTLKKYFVPHDENDHKPHALRIKSLVALLLVVFLIELALVSSFFTPLFSSLKNNIAAILPSVLVLAANEERAELQLGMLDTDPLLVQAAQLKANDMAERGFFAHVNPDGQQPWVYLDRAGYAYDAAGENLAVNFLDSKDVHRAWMKSPTHKANIVQSKFTEIGIATARGTYEGEDVIFVVQFFGTPKASVAPAPTQVTTTQPEETVEPEVVVAIEDDQATDPVIIEESVESESEEVLADSETTAVLGTETPTASEITVSQQPEVGVIAQIVSAPRTFLTYILAGLLAVIAVALVLAVAIRRDIQHPKLLASGIAVVAIILTVIALNQHYLVDTIGVVAQR